MSGLLRLHHVGYVVADIAQSITQFTGPLGASWDGLIYSDAHQRVKVTFVVTQAGDAMIELVEPDGTDSPVAGFLATKGGIHHVCYETPDLGSQISAMRARGARLAKPPRPAVAFGGRRIAWVVVDRLLVELLES